MLQVLAVLVSRVAGLRRGMPVVPLRYPFGFDRGLHSEHAYLSLADTLVVTGESMSMMTEASATGKPLYIFDVGDGAARWWLVGISAAAAVYCAGFIAAPMIQDAGYAAGADRYGRGDRLCVIARTARQSRSRTKQSTAEQKQAGLLRL